MEEENTQPTPEQIAAYNKARAARHEEQKRLIPLLKTDKEYLSLLADIDEAILRREVARHRFANMNAPADPEKKDEPETKEPEVKA